jgi:hypothetical protein
MARVIVFPNGKERTVLKPTVCWLAVVVKVLARKTDLVPAMQAGRVLTVLKSIAFHLTAMAMAHVTLVCVSVMLTGKDLPAT